MPVFEITSPDGRILEIEGDKAPSERELDNIFKSIPAVPSKGSANQIALTNVKTTDDEPEIGMSIVDRFNKLKADAALYANNIPKKESGMTWIEYAKLRKKYDEDWNLNTPDLNPIKAMWKMSVLGSLNEKLYRGQKEKRAKQYTDNMNVLTQIPAQAQADWLKKGEIKAGEALMRSDWSRAIPFIASGTTIDESSDINRIIEKRNKGEELSRKEITQLNAYILDVAEQNYRGISFGGKLIQGALELPSFAGEFMTTGGLASIGKNAIQRTFTKGLQNVTKEEIGKRLTKGALEGAAGAVTRTSLGMPQRVAENYGMRKLHESLGITDKGQVILETADISPARTFLKAWGDTVIENWSEEMGAGLGEAAGLSFRSFNKLVSPLEKKLFSRNTRAAFIKAIRKFRPNATVKDIMTRAGFNGILEEMGEERAGDVLRVVFGIDDRQDISTFDKLCEAINPGAEELLLELGLFSIPGSMSFAASQVAKHLRNQNIDESTISDYIKLSSELEKEKLLGDIADNRDLTNAINFQNSINDLKNRYFTQNLNAGLEKEEALSAADIQANAISSLARNIGMDINELNNEFAINLQNMTDKEAKVQYDADTKVLQGGIEMNVEQHNQPYSSTFDKENIEKSFGDSVENITNGISQDVKNILAENNIDEADFKFQDIRVYGSFSTSTNKDTSDLDVLVQYSGNMREDDAFNLFAEANLSLKDKNGNQVKIDINPINIEDSGTIDSYSEHLINLEPKSESIDKRGVGEENSNIYFQSAAMRKSRFDNFADFYNDVLSKPKNTNNKEQFNAITKDGLNIRIPHDTVIHDINRHKLSSDEWQDLLNHIDSVSYAGISKKKSRFGGTPVLLKIDTNNNCFGVVLETFAKNNPLISTAFVDAESNIEKWIDENTIKNEAVPNGTKTTFLDISLNNIITNINPKFKSKSINNKIYFQKKVKESPGQIKLNFDDVIQMNLFKQEQIFASNLTTNNTVQQNIKNSYTEKDIITEKKEEITDVGDSLLGNLKKNKKEYSWEELEKMNDLLRSKYLSKNYIIQMPTFEELQKSGLSAKSAAYVLFVYSKINSKPAKGYDSIKDQKTYYEFVHEIVSQTQNFAKEYDDEINNYSIQKQFGNVLLNKIFPDKDGKNPYNIFRAYPEYNRKAVIVGGNKLVSAIQYNYSTNRELNKFLEKINSKNDANKKTEEKLVGWRKQFDVQNGYKGWFVADKKSGMIITSRELPSKEIAEAYAQKVYEYIQKNNNSITVDFSNLRDYIPRRKDNQNVKPEALIEVFGFRGINFGNWTKQSERQDFVNLAYDSLYDLSEILNLPPKAMSLGGKLGLAFGAQGRSSAAGHFIPEYNEINLTRKAGAGSFAHEWWHALDYYFGDQKYGKDFSGVASLSLTEQGLLRKEIYNAINNIKEQLKYSPLTEKEISDKEYLIKNRVLKSIEYLKNDIASSFKKSKNADKINDLVQNVIDRAETINIKEERDELDKTFIELLEPKRQTFDNLSKFSSLQYQIDKLQKVNELAQASKKYSKYYQNAERLNYLEKGNKTGYWTKDTELGARAFASYILYKINQKNFINEFLVRDEKQEFSLDPIVVAEIFKPILEGGEKTEKKNPVIEWYPAEQEERDRIFKAFDNLFENIKTREENHNLILFQKEERPLNEKLTGIDDARGFTYQRFNFDGTTKDNLIVLLKNKSDKSTLLHEFAHVYLTTLNNLALRNSKAKELLINVNKWLNYNGIEYTRQQHEKFANGFVAYVKSGKAPTYGLKRAFENFKRWLNDLYTNLSLSDDIELDNDTKKVFDELLGDRTIDAKDRKIEELINKAKQNALLRLSYEYSEKRKIQPLHLSDKQRRFRDTAYDILYTAAVHTKDEDGNPLIKNKQELYMLFGNSSDYKKKNKGIKHRREKIEEYLLEVDDPFSGGDGFLPNWGEFFTDPGVSYKNMDSGADAELIKQALDVINEKRYLYDSDNLRSADNEFNEEDVKKAQYELEYLIDDYKNTKNKDITMAAFFDWADTVHPYIQEDIVTQWENKTNEIDRYENLTEFQKAKEDLKIYAATLEGYGDYSSQFAEYARKIIKRLDFMTEHDKMKIFDKLKEYNSFREIERNLDSVMDYAETLNDVSLRKNLADTIINEIKRTTPEIVKGTKKTRYDYQTNKLFERLREINRMKQEQVNDLYDAYVNGELERRAAQFEENGTITGKTEDYFEDIENSFIQFKANGIYYNSTEALQTLLDKIQNAKFTGKVARDEMDFQQRMNQQNWINQCAKAVDSHKGKVGKFEELYSMEANFDTLLSMIFDDNVKNKFSLDLLYAQVDGKVGKDRQEVLEKIADVFGYTGIFKGAMLNNKFIEMANDKYTIKQRYANKEETDNLGVWNWETITLSKMEILYYYIQAKNPTSYQMLTDMGDETRAPKGQFDRGEFEELLSNLSPQEKLVGDILQLAAEKYYPELNKYHIKKHHIDMGKVTCYFPRKSELKEVNELDLFNQYTQKSTNPKFVKVRSAGPSIRISPANPINVLFNHIQKANTIIIMGDQLDLMNKVFRDNDLKAKITAVFGDKVYIEFMQHVTANLYNGQTETLSNAEGIISRLMSNIIAAPMFIKPQIGLKQVLGLINYGLGNEHVGSLEWLRAFIKTMRHPVDAINFMMQDDYLKDRLTRANLNEAMKNQVDNKLFSRVSLLNDYFSLNMRFGDLLNLCWGGKAYIDVLMAKGFTKEQAFELFRQKTISDQQSSINSTLSNLQRNSKNNPFARLVFAYQNTPHQYFRICANAIMKAKQGNLSKKQAAKTVFIYWYLLPLIFNMAGSLSPITYFVTGDPDEIYSDLLISCLGSITCIPFFGEMARALWSGITGQEYFGNRDWFTRFNQAIINPINKIKKDDLSFEDILKSLEIFAQGAGIPLEAIDTQIEAIGDYADGNIAQGLLKTLGFSRYRAKKVTGEED